MTIVVVSLLGAAGALIRYALHDAFVVRGRSGQNATVWANALGAVGLGVIVGGDFGPWVVLIGAGLCGALSTLSTLAVDIAELLRFDRARALRVLSGHVVGSLVAFGVGLGIGLGI